MGSEDYKSSDDANKHTAAPTIDGFSKLMRGERAPINADAIDCRWMESLVATLAAAALFVSATLLMTWYKVSLRARAQSIIDFYANYEHVHTYNTHRDL